MIDVKRKGFREAMTHESYYSKEGKGNSRFVFLGMFGFKGMVSEVLHDWMPGRGQTLQQILGNHFSNSRLAQIFDEYDLGKYVRCGDGFDIAKHRHIFVFAYFGMIFKFSNYQQTKNYITSHFLDNSIIEACTKTKYNRWEQLILLCQSKYNKQPKKKYCIEEGCYICTITVGNDQFASHTSKSKTYATKKCIDQALKHIADESDLTTFIDNQMEKHKEEIKVQKALKHEKFLARNNEKKEERAHRKELQRIENIEKEKSRKLAKQNVKKAKERRKENKIVISEGMNAAKRRRLEDKMK